jgi:MoaA/NifB/PqqE/SkfB family radical SAM enzyme
MDKRRWSNVTEARQQYERRDERAGSYPIEAFFEVAARCNLRCQMCAINYDPRYAAVGGQPPFFEPDLFARLRPIFPSLVRAYLFGLGEPTLNKHLVDYVRELATLGVEVSFNTNATLIDDAKAEALAAAGADRIVVSIDGATAETYETIRRGAKFEAVLRGIRALAAARQRHGGKPHVALSFVAMSQNVDEMPAMIDLCAELGAEGLHVEPLYYDPASRDLNELYARENLGASGSRVDALFDETIAKANDRGIAFGSRFIDERDDFDYIAQSKRTNVDWTCSEPWSAIWVTSAGDVRTCCLNGLSFGNLFEQTFDEIWNGEPYRRFRAQHARREVANGCGSCVTNGRVRQSPYFDTVKRVTYRPLFRELPPVMSSDPVTIETPLAGTTVTDPLIVTGRMARDAEPVLLELMIDETPVANFRASALIDRDAFAFSLDVSFVSEGAHIIWARRCGETGGFAHRQVFLWRPESGEALRATDEALFTIPRDRFFTPMLTIAGKRWDDVRWQQGTNPYGRFDVAHANLSALPPGEYDAEVRVMGRVRESRRLRKL